MMKNIKETSKKRREFNHVGKLRSFTSEPGNSVQCETNCDRMYKVSPQKMYSHLIFFLFVLYQFDERD